jgi:hypothetical protein
MAGSLLNLLDVTLNLSEQFSLILSGPTVEGPAMTSDTAADPASPLPLLAASAGSLKAQSTKLSLLAINSPFTPSAVATVISSINDTVLPSLVTAALLTTPESYTQTFHEESKALVKEVLRELSVLANHVKGIAENGGTNLSEDRKHVVTTATARLWNSCDRLVALSEGGVFGLVIKKATEYLELVRDGVRELEAWDPNETLDDPWGIDLSDVEDNEVNFVQNHHAAEDQHGVKLEELQEQRKYMLRLLKPISQIYPTIISRRLQTPLSVLLPSRIQQIEILANNLRDIPNLMDEAAGSLYEHDLGNAVKYTARLIKCAVAAVETVRLPWDTGEGGSDERDQASEDRFRVWVETWLKVIGEMSAAKEGLTETRPNG